MNISKLIAAVVAAFTLAPCIATGQPAGVDPAAIGRAPTDSWPTYHGDYTGRRFSPLTQIDAGNVKGLGFAWVYRLNTSTTGAIMGGEGQAAVAGNPAVKSTPLMVDGVLYFAAPDHVWAVDARTGRETWHYFWKTTGGIHIGNRGVGIYRHWLYFLTPDDYLVSLDIATGKERWRKQISSVKREYFSTTAPIIVGDHVIIGTGGDSLDVPGYLEARNPETGDLQWRWYTTPRTGDPALSTWPSEAAAIAGAGHPWVPGSFDPELGLYYVGTGNPNPVLAGQGRLGDNLWTASVVAIDIKTGKLRWYFQVSPHDTHDYDAAQDVILIDGVIDGKPRKLLAQMSRNGHYFLFDRATGEHILTTKLADTMTWTKGIAPNGQPIRDPAKDPSVPGTLVSPSNPGVTNWPPPSFSPKTGLIYVGTTESYSVFYLTDTDPHPQGYGASEHPMGNFKTNLKAIDYKTGKIVWDHPLGLGPTGPQAAGAMGLLSTAGGLVFGNDGVGDFVAYRDTDGKPLWHADLGAVSTNGPISYVLDGKQYVVVGAGNSLYAFALQ
jgi:acido-empty-quinoprotein group A